MAEFWDWADEQWVEVGAEVSELMIGVRPTKHHTHTYLYILYRCSVTCRLSTVFH